MSGSTHGGDAINAVDRTYSRLEDALNLFAAGFIFFLMLLATVQVVSRKLLNLPIPGYIDYAEQSIAIFAFLGIAYCQRLGGHVRMELLLDKLKRGRMLWIAEAITTFAAFVIIVLLARYSFDHFLRAWNIGDSTIDINLPVWPSKLLVSVALAIVAGRLLIQLAGFIRLVLHPKAEPVAVPLIAEVTELAAQEAVSSGAAPEESR